MHVVCCPLLETVKMILDSITVNLRPLHELKDELKNTKWKLLRLTFAIKLMFNFDTLDQKSFTCGTLHPNAESYK